MSRRAIAIAAAAGTVAVAALAAGLWFGLSGGSDSGPGTVQPLSLVADQCPPVKGPRWVFPATVSITSTLYEAYAVSYPCAKAATYIQQFARMLLPDRTIGDQNPISGVPGYSCIAYPDRHGHAYGGSCKRGSSEFGWNWNALYLSTQTELNGKQVQTWDSEYAVELSPLGGNRYRLEVENASGIGAIDAFRWSPPGALTITAVGQTSGGSCRLETDGSLSCRGRLAPPKCLCQGVGGTMTIAFSATSAAARIVGGHRVVYALVGAHLRILAMTPVPYLIPANVTEERTQHGV